MRSFRLLLPLLSLYASPIAQSPSAVSVRRRGKQPTLPIAHLLALVGILASAVSFLPASSAFAQSTDSPSQSLNTRLKPAPLTTGTVTVNMTGQFATSPSDSFTLYKRIYTGTTNCNCPTPPLCTSPGGGPVTYVQNVSASSTDSTTLATTDSLLLQGFPGSNRNGQGPGFSSYPYPDAGATITYLPGNAVCVAISDALTHNIRVSYTPGAQVLDATCTNPKFLFKPGETVCVRVVGTTATAGTPWHLSIGGGSINSCYSYPSLPAYPGTAITAETQTVTYTLPASNSDIPAYPLCGPGGGSSGTTDIRGNWQVTLRDQGNNARGSDNFRLHDNNPSYDLSVYESVSDKYGQSGYPPAGFIKYAISVQNNGPDAAPNATLVASMPASTTYVSMIQTQGPQFTCGAPSGGNVMCTRASFAPDNYASFELLVSYSGQTNGAMLSNTATVSGGSGTDFYSGNNTYGAPQTTVTITNNTNVGQFLCPADITTPSTSASGATVTFSSFTTTAPYTGGSFAQGPASGSVFPIGTTYVGWVSNLGSGGCNFKVNVTDGQRPDLTATKSHVGFFARGQGGAQYSIVVTNTGGLATSGTVTVDDPLRMIANDYSSNYVTGLTPISMSGSGWTCNVGTISCSRNDALAAGASYPPITFTVNVARTGVYNLTNRAYVSGGGQTITANDEAADLTTVISPVGGKNGKTTGIFRPSTAAFFLKNTNATGFADILITFGNPSDIPISGDWNGDGISTVGIFRNGTFFLKNTNATGYADVSFAFGNSGDLPVAGDWDGDGVTTIGVYRNGTFYLRNSNSTGPPDLVFNFGGPGDLPIAGDWDGNGTDTIGVYRPSTGQFFLRNSNSSGFSDLAFTFGNPTDKPVSGDWDGDGVTTVGIYRNGTFYLRNSNSAGYADVTFNLGNPGDLPVAGDWDGLP